MSIHVVGNFNAAGVQAPIHFVVGKVFVLWRKLVIVFSPSGLQEGFFLLPAHWQAGGGPANGVLSLKKQEYSTPGRSFNFEGIPWRSKSCL
jgi:hypothetical protein